MANEERVNVMQVEKEVDPFSENAPKPDKPENPEKVSKQSRKEAKIKKLLAKKAKNNEIIAKRTAENAEIDRQVKLLEMSKEERTEYTRKLDAHCKIVAGGALTSLLKLLKNSDLENISISEIKNMIMSNVKTPEEKEYFEKIFHA